MEQRAGRTWVQLLPPSGCPGAAPPRLRQPGDHGAVRPRHGGPTAPCRRAAGAGGRRRRGISHGISHRVHRQSREKFATGAGSGPSTRGSWFGIDRWPTRATSPAVRPLPAHELAVPAEERRRGDEEGDPAVTRDDPTRGREEDPVDGPELRWARRPLEHPELMAEDEDLEVLRALVVSATPAADEETDEGPDDEVEERPHRPIVPG